MKLKKLMVTFILVVIAIVSVLAGKTYAAEASYNVGITNIRESGGAYTIQPNGAVKKVWKIVTYPATGAQTPNYTNAFYCIRAEKGFALNNQADVTAERRTYNSSLDMKLNKTKVLEKLQAVGAFTGIDSSSAYNKIMWIMDNMYLPNQSDATDYKKALLDAAGITTATYTTPRITDDDIEVVQQLALWHYTNAEDSNYNTNTLPILYFNNNSGQDTSYKTLEDLYNTMDSEEGLFRQQECEMLYNYFITNAEKNADYVSTDATSPLTLDKERVQISEIGDNYVIGPIKIEKNSDLLYTLKTLSITDESGKDFTYTLLKSDKQTQASTVQELINQDFYISVSKDTTVERVNFSMSITYNKTQITYYTTSDSTYTDNQPLVLIEKTVPEYKNSLEVVIPEKKEFDLALRKFITAVNDVAPEVSRVPVVDISKLKTGAAKTATYTHPKNPLRIEKGDKVTYTIRVYNEGDIDGYAKEITDYLPSGLELADSALNTENGWVKVTGTNKITTTKLADQLIKAFDGTTLSYKDIKVDCIVTTSIKEDNTTLKNIAEISGDADKDGNQVSDRDSQPNNVKTDGYTTQQQDDDDFEDLLLPGRYFDLALRKFITSINDVAPQVSREPVVDISKLKAGTATTATYTHPKNSLRVEKGDTVIYTIRVYNEGQLDGYAKEITDYLPSGLELVENSALNTENGWVQVTGTNRITTTKLADQLIKAFDGTTLSYKDVQVECKVIAERTTDSITLKNIAEISEDADKDGSPITDRDSQPDNVVTDGYTTQQQDDDDYENLILPGKYIDLSLRKFITAVNDEKINREPTVDISKLVSGDATTAIYTHPKTPVAVQKGDIVTYTIRVYNEGELDAYAEEITDHLPEYLDFLPYDDENIANGWIYDENDTDLRTVKTNYLSKDADQENLIKAFDGTTLSYKDITIKCKVNDAAVQGDKVTNIADISDFADETGNNEVTDRDSYENDVVLPTDANLPQYKDEEIERGDTYIPGQQDDDDFEKLIIQIFDLSLRKFITQIDEQTVTTRVPQVSIKDGKLTYVHPKDPVEVENGDIVTYTIRVYNEGDIAGYAKEVTDDLPEGLEFLPDNTTNTEYRWKMIDKDGKETTNVEEAVKVTTDYLSKEQEKVAEENLLNAFDKTQEITDANPDYKDVKIAFKVVEPSTSERILINTAEISDDSDKNGDSIKDIDSTPGNNIPNEDDIDTESVKLVYFDLALRKFITQVGSTSVNNRIPKPTVTEDGTIKYEHTKTPVEVKPSDIVTYTIRVYNEGKMAGYAQEVTDDIPQGLEFLPDNTTNTEYRWKMIDKDGKETANIKEAVKITTDYLSKEQEKVLGENLIKAFDKGLGITDANPDYKDVKVAFKVVEPETSDRIVINTAEVSDDANKEGKPVEDIDSKPGNDKPEEDDIDTESVKVKYFDLSLKKWVTQSIVIKDGKETVTETGHTGDETPEPPAKVDLKASDIKKVTVKFAYKIKVTNEGQIDGYAKEVKDYIPDGLKFVASDNPQWKQISEKVVVTDELANKLLRPGESATVSIILTWENSEDNLNQKVNVAEISKDYNSSNTPDIDSTPDNNKLGEDDIDDAPVLLTIRTGEHTVYVGLAITVTAMFAGGIYLIKKFVL